MELKNYIFTIVFIAAFSYLFINLSKVISFLRIGKNENRFNNPVERFGNVVGIAFGQSKLLREPIAGIIHFLIFWGFILFIFAVIEAIFQGFISSFNFEFLGPFNYIITGVQDLFGLLVIISVLSAFYRRFVLKIKRLEVSETGKKDAALILLMILMVVISMFGQNSALIAKNSFILGEYDFRPISSLLASILFTNASSAVFWYEFFWWFHILLIFTFINYLPFSKHFHVITSIPNVYFSKIGDSKYALKPIDLEDETIEQFGVADVEHLTWKQLLDGYACTECGRCTDVCPANNTGKLLSPRKVITDIRKRLEEKAPLIVSGKIENSGEISELNLVGDYTTGQELWACTTCNACVQECPVMIEHVDAIVDMRRNLVLMESDFPSELNNVFKNIETKYSPWEFDPQERAKWAEGLNIKTMSEDSNCDILFWVGCAGSYDSRYQSVSKSFSRIMQKAGINFRILGTEEKCNGDTARRLGNEYLAQTMMQQNIETLNNYNVKRIVTACPHCFNTLKNEYPQFGGEYEVFHHTEFISQLIYTNRIKFNDNHIKEKITFHDSCYLGRYNDIYDEPRNILKDSGVDNLVEMDRIRDKGFCCGAGGGQMFLEENEGTRVNINRTEEAIKTGAEVIASACPFCMTMMTDGIKHFEKQEQISVKDIAEIVDENML